MNINNNFLLNIGKKAKQQRVPFWSDSNTISIRITETAEWKDVGLWFRTSGCTYDAKGGCIMCDYSNGPDTTAEQMVSYVNDGLSKIPEDCRMLLVSPSGSMFDRTEVPIEALESILKALKRSPFKHILFETRAETITEHTVKLCKTILGERFYGLYVGLEAVSPFILKYCINKQMRLSSVIEAISICKANSVHIIFNVLVGIPFLSAEENIISAVDTVNWGLSKGALKCDLFPIHVKCATPLETLYNRGLYSPPSLWELNAVINKLDEDKWKQVGVSWYTSKGAYNIISSPTTCSSCIDKMIEYLDGFSQTGDSRFIYDMNRIYCPCKYKWRNDDAMPLPNRIIRGYSVLAKRFMGDQYWEHNKDVISKNIYMDWESAGGINAL